MILRFSRFSLSVRTVLFIKTIFPNFYPGQILLAMRLKICALRPNSTQEVEKNTIVFLPTFLSCSSRFLRTLQQKKSTVQASLFAKII